MQISKVSIELLNNAVYNPRKDLQPTDPEYVKLKNSVEHFGYVEPIIVNKNGNVVVGGHQRLKVLKDLGYKDIDVVYVDLSVTDEKALNIALNKISGEWDAEKLEDLLRDISLDTDFDVELTGFTLDEVEKIMGSIDDYDIDPDDLTDDFELKNGEPEFVTMRFTLRPEHKNKIEQIIKLIIESNAIPDEYSNDNKNGAALYEVIRQWEELKRLN